MEQNLTKSHTFNICIYKIYLFFYFVKFNIFVAIKFCFKYSAVRIKYLINSILIVIRNIYMYIFINSYVYIYNCIYV